jgi:polysaccharide deacetylase 2 family uncharacterized protein YibQ
MSEDYSDHKRVRKRDWFGVRPGFLIAGAIALLAFGAIFGISLDIATRPTEQQPAAAPAVQVKPSRQVAAPRIEIPADIAARNGFLETPPAAAPRAEPAITANAVALPSVPGQAVIAIVIDDMGLDRPRALKMIEMKGPLTLSLMTYADALPALVAQAQAGGHEIMAHLPMEPLDPKENPGPGALMVSMDEAAIRRTIAADLDGWKGYVGVNNHMGSKFTKDPARMAVVMQELKARGLLWLDSKTIGDTAGPSAAKAAGVPYIERDVFLDNVETVEAVTAQLEQLAAVAKTRGTAIGIGHPHDATIAALQKWLPTLNARGITLVPVTEILKRRSVVKTTPP